LAVAARSSALSHSRRRHAIRAAGEGVRHPPPSSLDQKAGQATWLSFRQPLYVTVDDPWEL